MTSSCGKEILQDIDISNDEEQNIKHNHDTSCVVHPIVDNIELKVGMVVHDEQEAYELYNRYALNKGFSIRRGTKRYIEHTRILRQHTFLCSCEGFSQEEYNPDKEKKFERLLVRTGCRARVIFKVKNGVYEIDQFLSEHNHPLVKPEQRHLIRSGRKIMDTTSMITSMTKTGVGPKKAFTYLSKEVGSQNVGFTKQACHNLLQTQRLKSIDAGDAQSLVNYFKSKQAKDPLFFYKVQMDEENQMTTFFWRDGLSRLDYNCFGDVIIFDTTYRTNKYNMICAPFIGVNHHRKNALFGCALLLDEATSSFVWLFQTFLESMGNKAPKTIFTDQDQAMTNAIQKVFPGTRHRLCTWQISKNAVQNISHFFSIPGFKNQFTELLHGCESEIEFESTWISLVEKWGIGDNKWLKRLYDFRHKWCPAFSRDTFSADIRSIQRSESIENVFEQMACKAMNLTELVLHYEDTTNRWRDAEIVDDVANANSQVRIIVHRSTLLKQAAKRYTHKIFNLFQDEYLQAQGEDIINVIHTPPLLIYKLRGDGSQEEYTVHFHCSDNTITCTCHMFELKGWLCRHVLKAMNINSIKEIPEQYILKRWTKGVKEGAELPDHYDNSSESSAQSSKTERLSKLMRRASSVMNLSTEDDNTIEIAMEGLNQIEDQVKKYKAENIMANYNLNKEAVDDGSHTPCSVNEKTVLDPRKMQPKGVTCGRLKGCSEKRKKRASKEATTSHPAQEIVPISSQPIPSMSIGTSSAFYPTWNQFASPIGSNLNNQFGPFLYMQISNANRNLFLNN